MPKIMARVDASTLVTPTTVVINVVAVLVAAGIVDAAVGIAYRDPVLVIILFGGQLPAVATFGTLILWKMVPIGPKPTS